MKKAACYVLLLALGVAAYLICPQNAASKARFCPPETPETITNSWAVKCPVRQIDDGQDDIYFCAGGEGMATTGFLTRSNGQTISIDLTGKNVLSAKVRFRGVNGSTTTYEYKTSPPAEKTGSAPAGASAFPTITVPDPPTGYNYYKSNVFASVIAAVSGEWWISASVDGSGVGDKSGTGTYGAMSVEVSSLPGKTVSFTLGHAKGADTWVARVSTVGKKAVTTTTYSTDPSCAGGKHSGTLTGGTVSSWYTASLASDKVNTLTVSVGGSGKVDVEIEYTYENIKLPQPAPSAPSVSNLTPTSVTLTSDAGSLIVCNGETKASGSTWSGLTEQTNYSAWAYLPETDTHLPSPASASTSFTTPSSSGPPSVQTLAPTDIGYTSAIIRGNVSSANGATPTKYLRWGYSSDEMSNVIEAGTGTGQFSAEIQLDPGEKYFYQAYATNSYGTSQGAVLSFETPYPRLPAPTRESPEQGSRLQDRRPWLIFTLPTMEANPATAYHAKARVSEYAVMSPLMYTFDSAAGTGDWQFWDGAAWLPFPAEGVAPGTKVRCRAPVMMAYRAFYWDCTAFDGTVWGTNSSAWDFRILIAVSRTFSLVINEQEIVGVKDIAVSETCNGELGEIAFSLDNKQGQASETAFNDLVILGINDKLNNADEFRGLVRDKAPVQGKLMRFSCITGDGILAERIVKKDYAAQDIGLSLKDAIDTYGAPLTSAGIPATTGIVAEIKSKDKSLLQMFEQVRRDYNLLYRVDNEFVVHLYGESAIQPAIVQIQYGNGGV